MCTERNFQSLCEINVDIDKHWFMGYFWGERGSIEQNMNPTLSRLILDGDFI